MNTDVCTLLIKNLQLFLGQTNEKSNTIITKSYVWKHLSDWLTKSIIMANVLHMLNVDGMLFDESDLLEICESSCVDPFQPGTNIWPTTKENHTLDLEQTITPFETEQHIYTITNFTR
jgi:hypothetical protein